MRQSTLRKLGKVNTKRPPLPVPRVHRGHAGMRYKCVGGPWNGEHLWLSKFDTGSMVFVVRKLWRGSQPPEGRLHYRAAWAEDYVWEFRGWYRKLMRENENGFLIPEPDNAYGDFVYWTPL